MAPSSRSEGQSYGGDVQTWQKFWQKKKLKRHYGNRDIMRQLLWCQITSCSSDHAGRLRSREPKYDARGLIVTSFQWCRKCALISTIVSGIPQMVKFHLKIDLEFKEELFKRINSQRLRSFKKRTQELRTTMNVKSCSLALNICDKGKDWSCGEADGLGIMAIWLL